MSTTTTTRPMPWDVMGEALSGAAHTDLAKGLAESGLDYTVRTAPVVAHEGPEDEPVAMHSFLEAPKARAIIRPMHGVDTVIGVAGTRYTPIQNPDAFAVGQDLVRAGGQIVGLADYRSGTASIMVVDLGQEVTVKGPKGVKDTTVVNLVVTNPHAGNGALTFALTPVRLACTNALPAAIHNAPRVWKFSHTPKAGARMDLAMDSIRKAAGYAEAFQGVAQRMASQEMVDAEFLKIVQGLWPVADDAEGKVADRKRERQAEVVNLYRTSETLDGVRGTLWGGYNALTEYLDHFRPVNGPQAVTRAEGALDGPSVRMKANLWRVFANA